MTFLIKIKLLLISLKLNIIIILTFKEIYIMLHNNNLPLLIGNFKKCKQHLCILFSMINLPWSIAVLAHWKCSALMPLLACIHVYMYIYICTSRQQCDSFSLLTMTTGKIHIGLYHDFYSNYFLKHIKHDTCSRNLWVFAGYRTNYNLWSQFLNSNIYRYRDSERRCKCSKIGVRRNSHFGIDFWVKHGFHSENDLMGLIKQWP